MVKVSVNRFVTRRLETTKKQVRNSTQKLRNKTLKNLEQIYRAASRMAKGDVKHQRSERGMVPVTLNQRRKWTSIAAHAAKTMNTIASNIDEREINTQLDELDRLVQETNPKKRARSTDRSIKQ